MNDFQIFKSPLFGSIRTLYEDGKPLFCGKDIAQALGYSNTKDALLRHCRGVVKRDLIDALGRMQEAAFIPEGDVYRLITHSRLPAAQEFEHWVFDEVLPSIRRTGGYVAPEAYRRAMQQLAAEQARLNEWRELAASFEVYTNDAAKTYTAARKEYDRIRGNRDKCRNHVKEFEKRVDSAIAAAALLA